MRILATCSLGGAGHWVPLSDFLRASTGDEDEVLVVAPPALREMVEQWGFDYAAGGEPPEALVAPIRERLPIAPPAEASVLGNRELFARLAATAMLPGVEAACTRWMPDLVVRDPCEYAAAVVAADRSIRSAQIGISLAEVEWGSLAVASPALEAHRSGLTAEIARAPYVTRFPTAFDPSPFASTFRYRQPAGPTPEPLPDWWGDRSTPLVYLTLGTVLPYMTFAADTYRLLLRALADLDVRVLLTVGSTFDIGRLGSVPANAHVEPWVDQRRALAEATVTVCHGGSGTVLGALDAGVPMVVLPSFSDQHTNARVVERHRLGLVVDPSPDRGADAPFGERDLLRVTAAVRTILDDPSSFTPAIGEPRDEVLSAADVLRRLMT
ncbi:MAG TPA: glycosyltransferase [Ilumatobacteraceae bacterium]|nr:glycosyltransferase [Ilumatobacteraceae bacterium]